MVRPAHLHCCAGLGLGLCCSRDTPMLQTVGVSTGIMGFSHGLRLLHGRFSRKNAIVGSKW